MNKYNDTDQSTEQFLDDHNNFLYVTEEQETLPEPLQGDFDGSLSSSEYQYNADSGIEVSTAYSPTPKDWPVCHDCGRTLIYSESTELGYCNNCASNIFTIEQGQFLQDNSNVQLPSAASSSRQYKADLKQVLTISPHNLNLNQSSPHGASNTEGQQQAPTAYSPTSKNFHACLNRGTTLVHNKNTKPGYCNNCISGIVNTKQRQFLQGNYNGPLPSIVSSSKRKRNADLEQEQNFTNSPNKKRVNNDKKYTTSVNDAIIRLGRQTGLQFPDGFEFSREQSTKNKGMSKKRVLEHVSNFLDSALEFIPESQYKKAKLEERKIEERIENNGRTLRQTQNTVNESNNSTKTTTSIRSSIGDS